VKSLIFANSNLSLLRSRESGATPLFSTLPKIPECWHLMSVIRSRGFFDLTSLLFIHNTKLYCWQLLLIPLLPPGLFTYHSQEATRAYHNLNPVERGVLLLTRSILGNRQARVFFVCYALFLHMLVMYTTYECTTSSGKHLQKSPRPYGT